MMSRTGIAHRLLAPALLAAMALVPSGLASAEQAAVDDGPIITVTAPRKVASPVRPRSREHSPKALITLEISVRYADLHLADPADAARLMDRVESAARDACRYLDRVYPLDPDKECISRAVADSSPRAQAVIDAAVVTRQGM